MIPLVDLTQQYLVNCKAFEDVFKKTCMEASFILGPQVEHFEKRFSSYLGAKEGIGVASGTDALCLACQAIGVGPGDEVLIPANTFIATALAVSHLGAKPIPVDISLQSYLIDLDDAEGKITGKTKAIIPVHLYGQSMNMDDVLDFARKYNLKVIEDAAQAHGAMWKGRHVGTFGEAGCFSFYPSKNLGAFGDGGMVVTNNNAIAQKLRLLRNYGSTKRYIHEIAGTNSRLDSLQAAFLNVKLDFLDECNKKRFLAACRYADMLKDLKNITPPIFDKNEPARHVFHLFVIQCSRRGELLTYLNENEIACGIHYPVPFYLQKAFVYLGFKEGSCPVTERLAEKIISLPMFPELSLEQTTTVVNAIKLFYEQFPL